MTQLQYDRIAVHFEQLQIHRNYVTRKYPNFYFLISRAESAEADQKSSI